ncbi:hypothetical protein SEA_HUWBERT_77 [Microbacterium phage Huwbert]|nr:hypothetical protein SEA_HUWBERT_77 [Microbacterium phage Huwbert]
MGRVEYCRRARKVSFVDEIAAKLALAERIRKDKGEVRQYKCNFGNHYHLTSELEYTPKS